MYVAEIRWFDPENARIYTEPVPYDDRQYPVPMEDAVIRARARDERIVRDATSRQAVKEAHEMSGNDEAPRGLAGLLARFRRRRPAS